MGMSNLYYLTEEMRQELVETFEAAFKMALDHKDETTAEYYNILIQSLKKLKRAEHLQKLNLN